MTIVDPNFILYFVRNCNTASISKRNGQNKINSHVIQYIPHKIMGPGYFANAKAVDTRPPSITWPAWVRG